MARNNDVTSAVKMRYSFISFVTSYEDKKLFYFCDYKKIVFALTLYTVQVDKEIISRSALMKKYSFLLQDYEMEQNNYIYAVA